MNIFARIILGFMVVILPLYILSLHVNISIQNQIRMEKMEFSKSKLDFYLMNLNHDMQNIFRIQSEIFSNGNLRQLANRSVTKGDYDYFQCINQLRSKVVELKNISSFVDVGCVYIPSIETKISDTLITQMDTQEFNTVSARARSQVLPFSRQEDGYYIFMGSDQVGSENSVRNGEFIISVKISTEKIQTILSDLTDATSTAMLIENQNGLNIGTSASKTAGDVRDYIRTNMPLTEEAHLARLTLPEGNYIVTYQKSDLLGSTLAVYEPEAVLFKNLWGSRILLFVMSALTALLIGAFSLWIRRLVVKPLSKLISAFRNVGNGEFDTSVRYPLDDEFGFLYDRFNEMMERLRTLIKTVYEQTVCVKEAELKQLQYQINPHFLYNSILIVNNLIKMSDYDCAEKLTMHIGKYFQYITKNVTHDVPFQKEYDHVLNYIEIQSIRFSNRIRTQIDAVPETFRDLMVPKLILQPIVENAFNYGLKNKVKDAVLTIRMKESSGFFHISIEDNGESLTDQEVAVIRENLQPQEKMNDRSALVNVNTRIRIKFGENSGLFAARGESGGLRVDIRLEVPSHAALAQSGML